MIYLIIQGNPSIMRILVQTMSMGGSDNAFQGFRPLSCSRRTYSLIGTAILGRFIGHQYGNRVSTVCQQYGNSMATVWMPYENRMKTRIDKV